MLSAMQSPNTAHDEHLRRLLDQRTARAGLPNRFPSYAESFDSPSIYSHPVFSPRPGRSAEQSHYAPSAIEPRSPMSDRERLNDPGASTLDLEDDPRYSYASQDYSDDDHSSQHTIDDDEDDSRMSVLGPKMKFHSPAPWEMGGDVLPEEEEPESGILSRTLSEPRSEKTRGGMADGIKRGLGLTRAGSGGRPSNESSRSSGKAKQSFETNSSYISPGGALHALARASMSSTSLSLQPSSPAESAPKKKFPVMRIRTQTTSTANSAHLQPPMSPGLPSASAGSSSSSGSDSRTAAFRRRSRSVSPAPSPAANRHEYVHPYANPDLAFYDPPHESPRSPSHNQQGFAHHIAPSDSDRTVTEASTSASWSTGNVITPDNSTSSITHKAKGSYSSGSGEGIQIKGISRPIASRRPSFPDSHSSFESVGRPFAPAMSVRGLAGWQDTPSSPGFTLISLAEAQAQARERSRTATVQGAPSHSIISGPMPFPSQAPENNTAEQRSGTSKNTSNSSPTSSTFRTRARSISAGARAKNAFQGMGDLARGKGSGKENEAQGTSVDDHTANEAPTRTIKQKKSGFMRLFRDREKDKMQSHAIPPVPQLSSDALGTSGYGNQSQSAAPRRTQDLKRVPVPSLSPSLLAESDGLLRPGRSDSDPRKSSPSPRRGTPPSLSIIPPSGPPQTLKEPFNPEGERGRSRTATPTAVLSAIEKSSGGLVISSSPRSAPPEVSDFQGLSLRPVSTAFSAHFSDHLLPDPNDRSPNRDSDLDLDTPTTMNTAVTSPSISSSPLGYGFPSIDSVPGNKGVSVAVPGEDQSAVIQALQEQIISARKGWQMQIWELEGQVRELKAELDQLRATGNSNNNGYCEMCGRGSAAPGESGHDGGKATVINRPRAPTGIGGRFGCSD
ncbi:hypothetical protein GLOTRDRAFT_52805 [Gloeophyllum trabeum ATCC 11539]|uniref:Uncharacterized protein n=1 Tax=Gloeophyllum trabeum (strain ATCC 11539 / FP-39264 / Madison 617) TaxID=670483 RepID=S7RZT0_GLOTA|nr:uncharacterized protein GLOTRDRAFT_52805 [Gloeophyllum trabeum ATCC 11539]EPQ60540.1 hypothetical protein GLOTRDRAFT_52805 [Gloeophyllum trabeum ATCC 11539]